MFGGSFYIMDLKQKYNIVCKAKKLEVPELAQTLNDVIKDTAKSATSIFLVDCWSAPYTKTISLITSELDVALKLNKYDNINIILASDKTIQKLLKREWVREYFSKQMPVFMVEEVLSLMQSEEDAESAWAYYIYKWLPENKMAQHILEFQTKDYY